MDEKETSLRDLPAPILDVDVDPFGSWVAVCGAANTPMHLVFNGSSAPVRHPVRFPLVRTLDADRAVLVDSRCRPRERNGWIVRSDGTTEHEFRAGDAIADIILIDDNIVVTYFDEAFGASDGLDGVVLLDRSGEPRLRYNDAFGVAVVDCYCACDAGRGRVFFLVYPDFPGVLLDVGAGTQSVCMSPRQVHGANAVTVAGDTAFFFGSYDDRGQIARWRFRGDGAERIGSHMVRCMGSLVGACSPSEAPGSPFSLSTGWYRNGPSGPLQGAGEHGA